MQMGTKTHPDKLYYRIGEVSRLTGVKPHVLRYWEQEFHLRPKRWGRPQRRYQKEDLETILTIKKLLYEERYTIAGAKKRLRELNRQKRERPKRESARESYEDVLKQVKKELQDIKEVLD